MPINEFYAYGLETNEDGYTILVYDLNNVPFEIAFTENKKIAEFLLDIFDNLAEDEEKNFFTEFIE